MTMTRRTAAEIAAVRQLRRALDGTGGTEAPRLAPDALRQRGSASPSPGVVIDEPTPLGLRRTMTGSALLFANGVIGGVVIASTSHRTFNLAALVIVLAFGGCLVGAATLTSWRAIAHPSQPPTHPWSRADDTDRPLASPWLA